MGLWKERNDRYFEEKVESVEPTEAWAVGDKAMCISVKTVSAKDDFVHCQNTVRSWAASSRDGEFKESKHTLRDLLFFLHVPRTGGRTYFYCFLKKLYTSYLECPRSYDKLRFDPSKSDCKLMSTHDDYSMMSKLPKERTSVVTIIRNPVDRVFSTYEFAVEVAARFLVHPNLTSATKMSRKILKGNNGVSTLDIWPWKYMVPWMREDLFARRNARNHGDFADIKQSNDSYNMEEVVMPLHEFITTLLLKTSFIMELLFRLTKTTCNYHYKYTFKSAIIESLSLSKEVAGLTNNSCIAESHEVRHCVRKYYTLGEYVLEVAKVTETRRLDDMLYVGLTEDHKESATMFANVVGLQLLSQLQALSSRIEQAAKNKTGKNCNFILN
ncbi:hypothetical protein GIB67_031033 [Kingdonia uniflora]|uniref:Sulfotransferase n=1 Tax=Kingdonia uniflora TaxID=39325 RepID=A0A7J7NG85_9MAGN|nr:hypothetical protein GIB67_031033 [Kingdonia uniflora]